MNPKKGNLKNYLKKPYSRILIPDDETNTFTAEILEFPGCIAQGDTAQEAYEQLEKAAESWIEAALELGQEVPPPSLAHGYGGKVALRMPKSLHRQATIAAERDRTSLNQFIVTAIAEKVGAQNLYEKLTGKIEQNLFQAVVNRVDLVTTVLKEQATTSMPVQFLIPDVTSLKEVTNNAGNQKYNFYS
jgi:predicted RNase H-like HicB family nuclease